MSRGRTVGLRSQRGPVLLALMLATGLIAIDATILATAVPTIVADLGDFDQFPWLFSVYLLAQTVSVPIAAKLADTVGRRPIILTGVTVFLVGSILCGLAWNMVSLIGFRAIQGLGAGLVAPMTMTIVGDLYTLEERSQVQGYIASVWAGASVVGPALGGVFSQFTLWRWIFLVNIPVCVAALWMLARRYHERVEPRPHTLDLAGAGLLTAALTCLTLVMLEGGHSWGWLSGPSVVIVVAGLAALIGFVAVERRAAEPVLDLAVLRRRIVTSTSLAGLGVGAMLIGLMSFAPTYLEGTLHVTPLQSGMAVAAFTIGWPIAASTAGQLYLRWGFRNTALLGSSIAAAGSVALALLARWPSTLMVAAVTFVIGFGLGWTANPTLIAAQHSVDWGERGVVTGVSVFARNTGSAVGAALFGAIANSVIAVGAGPRDRSTMVHAGTWVFGGVAVTAMLMMLAVSAMPRDAAPQRAP